jgi:hypothetical protein
LPVALMLGVLLWKRGAFLEQFSSVKQALWSPLEGTCFALYKLFRITMLVPILVAVIGFARAIRGSTSAQMIAAFTAVNWIVGFSGLLQVGSDVNYFLPGLAGCALLLPFAITAIRDTVRLRATFEFIIFFLVLAISVQLIYSCMVLSAHLRRPNKAYEALRPFKILSDLPVLTLHGRDPDLLDPFTSHNLELAEHWNSAPIIENVQRSDYDLVILASMRDWHVVNNFRGVSFFSPELVKAINGNYIVLCTTPNSAVLRPKAREVKIAPSVLELALGQERPCGPDLYGLSPSLTIPPGVR